MTPLAGSAVDHTARLQLFAFAWALAALFHVVGNAPYGQTLPAPTPRGIATLLLGLAAVGLLVRFRALLLVTVAALAIITAGLETPVLGNHWLLAAMVSGVLLVAMGAGRGDLGAVAYRFVPVAAALTVVAYGFMAFSKLNTGFLDPSVSCAGYFASRLATSWGLPPIEASSMRIAAIAGALIAELSLPLLLALRRGRMLGVGVGAVFHGLIALDLRQHFWDFSAVLLSLFLLFAPQAFVQGALTKLTPSRRRRIAVVWLAALLALALPLSAATRVVVVGVGHLMWLTTLGMVFVLLARHARGGGAWREVLLPRWPGWAWLVVPLLAAANGLTPYLEVKTAFGFNMYANLRTDRGMTNHLLVPRTWPLTAAHHGLVVVLWTDDIPLQTYVDSGYALPWSEFRAYLQARPETAVIYERDGIVHEVPRAGDDHGLMEPVTEVRRRLLAARAVDLTDPPRCQVTWGPAR